MAANASLSDYPALARWYADRRDQPASGPSERLVLETCEALRRDREQAAVAWTLAFQRFLTASDAPLKDFLAAETTMQRCDAELMDLIGDLGEAAVRAGTAERFFAAMQAGAEMTGLVVFRFLSAWTALNAGSLQACVDECEKVTEPFASVHTIHGQALLELGRPKEALEILEIATRLAPQELLAWFQKAKALHVLARHEEAFDALRLSLRLAPQSDEIAFYMAMIAVETQDQALWRDAWHALRPRHRRLSGLAAPTLLLIKLATMLGDKPEALTLLGESTWSGGLVPGDDTATLAQVLKLLAAAGWMDVATILLGKVTPRAAG